MPTKQAQNAPNKEGKEMQQTDLKGAEIIVRNEKRFIKTPKGTELPLLQLKGKDYLQVAHRLVWFREEHPDWQILTDPLEINIDKKYAVFRSSIVNNDGKTLATATKAESISGFADYVEKAETGATGRAVALCGFGTQFAPEFDEGERLADSPLSATKRQEETAEQTTPKSFTPHIIHENPKKQETCRNCSSNHLTIGLTKPDNPRNPNRPYWKCLDCPPEKSFSHWASDKAIHPDAVKVASQNRQADMPPLFGEDEAAAE